MTGKLESDATVFYFDGKKCAEDAALNNAETQLEYSAQIGKAVGKSQLLITM